MSMKNQTLPLALQARVLKRLCLLATLAGCGASPAPQYFGATRTEVTKGGINFVVFQKDDAAEVVRLGYLTRAQRAPVQRLMAEAAAEATGCAVRPNSMITGLPGDTGEARFQLDC